MEKDKAKQIADLDEKLKRRRKKRIEDIEGDAKEREMNVIEDMQDRSQTMMMELEAAQAALQPI